MLVLRLCKLGEISILLLNTLFLMRYICFFFSQLASLVVMTAVLLGVEHLQMLSELNVVYSIQGLDFSGRKV